MLMLPVGAIPPCQMENPQAPEQDMLGYRPIVRWHTTFSTYRRRPVFADDALRQECAWALGDVIRRNDYFVYALAIMPDHVHLVHDCGGSGHDLPRVMNNLKGA